MLAVFLLNCEDENPPEGGQEASPEVGDSSIDGDAPGVQAAACLYKTARLSSLDAVSENMAFSGGDLMTLFEGQQIHRAVYATENSSVEQIPLGGDTILLLTVSYEGGEIRDVSGNAPFCGSYLEVVVAVSARTSDTAFAEEVPGVAYFYKNEAEGAFQVRLYADLRMQALSGGFEIQSYVQPPEPEEVVLFLDQRVDRDGVLVGSVVVMTRGGAVDESPAAEYYQHALSWETALIL